MRAAFDGKQMSHRRVGEVLVVREPYWLSGLIAITPRELQERARKDSSWNGTNNRWLWLAVERRDERVMSTEPDCPPSSPTRSATPTTSTSATRHSCG